MAEEVEVVPTQEQTENVEMAESEQEQQVEEGKTVEVEKALTKDDVRQIVQEELQKFIEGVRTGKYPFPAMYPYPALYPYPSGMYPFPGTGITVQQKKKDGEEGEQLPVQVNVALKEDIKEVKEDIAKLSEAVTKALGEVQKLLVEIKDSPKESEGKRELKRYINEQTGIVVEDDKVRVVRV